MDEQTERVTRMKALDKALLDAALKLDTVSEQDYAETLKGVASLAKEINSAEKILSDERIENAKLVEDSKKNTEEERSNKMREKINIIQIVVSFLTGAFVAASHIWAFKRSTDKENSGDIYANKTDQTTVTNGLNGHFWDWFKK